MVVFFVGSCLPLTSWDDPPSITHSPIQNRPKRLSRCFIWWLTCFQLKKTGKSRWKGEHAEFEHVFPSKNGGVSVMKVFMKDVFLKGSRWTWDSSNFLTFKKHETNSSKNKRLQLNFKRIRKKNTTKRPISATSQWKLIHKDLILMLAS